MSAKAAPKANREFQVGLRAILLEVIAPALIILMLGSLFFFLLEFLYRGDYELPVHWVFGLYVFAIVLIGRISIMEGFARAQIFAIALMAAVFIQTGFGPHWVLVLLTWWAASKLTWDCTFIDESRDVTGQGLVSAAYDQLHKFRHRFGQMWSGKLTLADVMQPASAPTQTPHPASESNAAISHWIKELVWKRRRKNTPGLWAFYFFVAGLFVFGLGQLFIESSDRARALSLRAFAVYVFSGLGLMMFISLVGLYRYLKQRGAELPDAIARTWMIVGLTFALCVVTVVLTIPWPNTGLSLSSLIPQFKTARRVGESVISEKGKADGPQGSGKPAEKGSPVKGDQPTQQQGVGGIPGGNQVGNQPQGNPGSSSGGNQSGGKGPKPSSSGNQSSSNDPSQKSRKPAPSTPQKPQSSPEQGKPSDNQSAEQNRTQPGQQPSSNEQKPETRKSDGEKLPPSSSNGQRSQSNSNADSPPPPNTGRTETTASRTPSQPSPPTAETNPVRAALEKAQPILKSLLWVIGLLAAIVVFVRYRNEIVDGLINFFKSLGDLLRRTRRGTDGGHSIDAARAAPVVHQPFSAFQNPFDGVHPSQRSPNEIVQYTFAAFESLAREVQIPRSADETPLEFAARAADRMKSLGRATSHLAELYSLTAYAQAKLLPADVQPLRELWSRMNAIAKQLESQRKPAAAAHV